MNQKPIETNNMMSRAEFEEELGQHESAIAQHITVLTWGVIVAPLMPRTKSAGGIVLAQQTQDAEQYLTYIGKLIQVGASYYRSEHLLPFRQHAPKVGQYVLFKKYAGIPIHYRGLKLLRMADDELLMTVSDIDNFRMYL